MKIRTKRISLLLLLLAGVIWDCLCVWSILPLSLYIVSVVAVCGYSLMVIFVPLLFPGIAQAGEISVYMHELTAQEKQMSGATICLIFVWIVTLITCIVSPL